MKNGFQLVFFQMGLGLIVFLGLAACSGSPIPSPTVRQNPAPARRPAGTAILKQGHSPTIGNMTFKASYIGSHVGISPSLLEYTGGAFLEGQISFKLVMTSTCRGSGQYSSSYPTTYGSSYRGNTGCRILPNVNYSFICDNAHISGGSGGAMFVCESALIQGSSYTIYGELRSGVSLNSNYAIEYIEICKGPGAPPTCSGRFHTAIFNSF